MSDNYYYKDEASWCSMRTSRMKLSVRDPNQVSEVDIFFSPLILSNVTYHGGSLYPGVERVAGDPEVGLVELVALGPAERRALQVLLHNRVESGHQEVVRSGPAPRRASSCVRPAPDIQAQEG